MRERETCFGSLVTRIFVHLHKKILRHDYTFRYFLCYNKCVNETGVYFMVLCCTLSITSAKEYDIRLFHYMITFMTSSALIQGY